MDKASPSSENKQLATFLQSLRTQIYHAKTREDLRHVLHTVRSFGRPLCYNNTSYWLGFSMGILLGLLAILYAYWYPNSVSAPWLIGAGGLTSVIFAVLIYMRRSKVNDLSDALFKQDVYLDNNWQSVPYHGKKLAAQLSRQFSEFKRGNHSREIEWLVKGTYQGTDHQFDYHAYHFHYVDQRQVTSTIRDSKGNVRVTTRTVYDHFHRYGLYLPFRFARNIAITNSWFGGFFSSSYKPASVEFNRKFKVSASDELSAAKFLKPAVVVEIEDLGKALSGLNLEFNAASELCISFEQNICQWQRQHGLDEPDAFLQEIEGDQKLVTLQKTLERIHTLMRHSDNNF